MLKKESSQENKNSYKNLYKIIKNGNVEEIFWKIAKQPRNKRSFLTTNPIKNQTILSKKKKNEVKIC